MKARTFVFFGLHLAAALGGCEVHEVGPPPVTLQQYQDAKAASPNPFPPRTVVLHNLRRVLDAQLKEADRVESLRLVAHLGKDDPEVGSQLAALLTDEATSESLRQAALEALLKQGHAGLAGHVAGVLPRLGPDSPLKEQVLAWLAQHPAPGGLAEIVRLWSQEKSATGLNEPRYRQAVEGLSGRKWDDALVDALNTEAFGAKDAAMEILAARVPKDRLGQTLAGLQPRTDVAAALQAFQTQFDYLPTTREAVAACIWLHKTRQPIMSDASRLYADWRQNYGYAFELWDFHVLGRLAADPVRRSRRRTELIVELAGSLLKRPHVARVVTPPAGLYDFSDRFSKHVESLSMADLWRIVLLDEMLNRPRVQMALRLMAEGDRTNTRTAWGGLIFYEGGQAEAKLYPASYEDGTDDLTYVPGRQTAEAGRDAMCRFQGHFEKLQNPQRAGPTGRELLAARQGGYCGLVLTSLDKDAFCAHYYSPQGICISLGKFAFR